MEWHDGFGSFGGVIGQSRAAHPDEAGGDATTHFRRRARDYERLPAMVTGLHLVAFASLILHQFIQYNLSP